MTMDHSFPWLWNIEPSQGICRLLQNLSFSTKFSHFCGISYNYLELATNQERRHLLMHSGGQATETDSTDKGLHRPASSLCGC